MHYNLHIYKQNHIRVINLCYTNSERIILIIDDNLDNIKVVAKILQDEGFKIVIATNEEKILHLLHEFKIDLILLDVMMPNKNGFEVCREIKSTKDFEEIPIIFLSAKYESSDIIEGFKCGGVDYIKKPFFAARYIRKSSYAGFYNNLNKDGTIDSICRDWCFWIKPL